MDERADKRRIYELINMYLDKKIDEANFCKEFLIFYDLYLDYETLSTEERTAFSELGKIASRFSEFEEDIKKHPGIYYTKEELNEKTVEVKNNLTCFFEELKKVDEG
jgi:hypothetical protein